jgi:cytochrome c oxidase subunit 4
MGGSGEDHHGQAVGAGHQPGAAEHAGAAHRGYRVYWGTWGWLLLITLLEVGVVFVSMPRWTLTLLLVILAGMKAVLIVAFFMHLRTERISFIYAVLVPMVLGVILFFALIPDGLHTLRMR